jgi:hypothetical protein
VTGRRGAHFLGGPLRHRRVGVFHATIRVRDETLATALEIPGAAQLTHGPLLTSSPVVCRSGNSATGSARGARDHPGELFHRGVCGSLTAIPGDVRTLAGRLPTLSSRSSMARSLPCRGDEVGPLLPAIQRERAARPRMPET